MAPLRIAACVSLLCIGFAHSQQQPTSLPDGVRMPVSLTDDLNLQRLHVGDEVRLRVTNNLRGPSGSVVVPKDAIAVARVAEIQLASKGNEARLHLIVEKVSWKGGSLPLHAFIVPPLQPTRVLKVDPGHAHPMFTPDWPLVGIASHSPEGTDLYCKKNFVLEEGTSFVIEQLSMPGPSAPPARQ
jgi:hypothetical protein